MVQYPPSSGRAGTPFAGHGRSLIPRGVLLYYLFRWGSTPPFLFGIAHCKLQNDNILLLTTETRRAQRKSLLEPRSTRRARR